MSDLPSSNWSETAASNNASPPNGWPEGQNPSDVNNCAREMMAALKRWWNRANAVKTTGGTTSAYTLTYDVAASQYYDGEIFTFIANATNAAAATLNINGLGARQITLFGGNLLAGAIIANQVVTVRYKSSDTTFEIIPQDGWVRLGLQSPSGASTVDFTGIPSAVNNIRCVFELRPNTDNIAFGLRTYGADGNIDTGASDYAWWTLSFTTAAGTPTPLADTTDSSIAIGSGVDNGTTGFGGSFHAESIQTATYTKFCYETNYLENTGVSGVGVIGRGQRLEADRITGLRFFSNLGAFTGGITLFASS